MPDLTQILKDIEQGKPHAADQRLRLVYDEAYLRLVPEERRASSAPEWHSRSHFFAAAEAMRRILVECARGIGCC
jgi:hypothetical protein